MHVIVCVGYISATFVEAVEVFKCYPVNSENYCFYTSGSVLSWNEARQFCAGRNSTLPIITDEDIDNVFQQFIVNDAYSVIQNTSVWIDAHARPVNSSVSWHWMDGRTSGRLLRTRCSKFNFVLIGPWPIMKGNRSISQSIYLANCAK